MTSTQVRPDASAVRVALWRALHREIDSNPLILDDSLALELADPPPNWRTRGDMGRSTKRARASIVARARVAEDIVQARAAVGFTQYVILGAGLDSFAQRTSTRLPDLRIFEVDRPDTQRWKERRLIDLGLTDDRQTFVPVDFEAGESWWGRLLDAGLDLRQPVVASALGVSMYLSADANEEIFARVEELTDGSTLVVSFRVPTELIEPNERRSAAAVTRGAQRSGTPWLSSHSPHAILEMAHRNGFGEVEHLGPDDLAKRYFTGRADGLRPSSIEHLVIATR